MYIATCSVCGNMFICENFEESITNCPHCERRARLDAEYDSKHWLEDMKKNMETSERLSKIMFMTAKRRPAPLL